MGLALFALLLCPLQIVPHPPNVITMVSVSSADLPSNGISTNSAISDDGRWIAFQSVATDLFSGDTNATTDVFLHDRVTGTTTLMSTSSAGTKLAKGGTGVVLSGDGKKLGFMSESALLVPNDTNGNFDVFIKDVQSGQVLLVSATPGGTPGNDQSGPLWLNEDGNIATFMSRANDLVAGDSNGTSDIFVRDMAAGVTERISVATDGTQADAGSLDPMSTPDGRFVVFTSKADNLAPGDTNGQNDVYVRDRLLGTTELMSCAPDGTVGDNDSSFPAISADGRWVGFQSRASNLVPGDTDVLMDVFVKDRLTGAVEMISVTIDGTVQEGGSDSPDLSSDGRFVVFGSQADNLIPYGPTPHHEDHEIFLRDRLMGTTRQISLTPDGHQANLGSINPQMNDAASVIAFETYATDIVAGYVDANDVTDIVAADLDPWTALHGGLAGTNGIPGLVGQGLLDGLSDSQLQLSHAAPFAPALLLISASSTPHAFKGGTLVALPFIDEVPLVTDALGAVTLDVPWPTGIPSGTTLWFQAPVLDPAAVQGVAISEATAAVTP
jgi:Tol biopolymer transport system component